MNSCNQNVVTEYQTRLSRKIHNQTMIYVHDMECLTQLAHELRKLHWGKDLVGDTRPSPLHQIRIYPYEQCPEEQKKNGFLITISEGFQNSKHGAEDRYLDPKWR